MEVEWYKSYRCLNTMSGLDLPLIESRRVSIALIRRLGGVDYNLNQRNFTEFTDASPLTANKHCTCTRTSVGTLSETFCSDFPSHGRATGRSDCTRDGRRRSTHGASL